MDRITTDDVTDRMPKKEQPLKPEQIALLDRRGAKWRTTGLTSSRGARERSVDELVAERLATEGLTFSPERICGRWRAGFPRCDRPFAGAGAGGCPRSGGDDRQEARCGPSWMSCSPRPA